MRTQTTLALAATALLLAACDTVTSPVPLGEKPAVIKAENWQGRWFNAEGHLDITVVDAGNGLVRIRYDDDGEQEEMDLELRTANDWIFFNVTEQGFEESEGLASSPCSPAQIPKPDLPECEEQPRGYMWGRIRHTDNALISWSPRPEVFVRLVEQGLIPGTVEEGSVVLGPLSSEHYEIITSGSHGIVLDWENPMVLYRSKAE